MEEVLIYRGETKKQHTGFIEEKTGRYAGRFEEAVDQYMEDLADFERRCSRPDADREQLIEEITLLTESMLDACARYEREVNDPFAIKAAQVAFREKTNPLLSKSYCINRARTWPQGHQGDYNTLEIAYKNTPLSEGIGYYLDKYFLSATLADGVRERITMLRELLKTELVNRQQPKVLDVACGSCREVFEAASAIKASGAKFVCIDLDSDALDYALDRIALAGLTDDQVKLHKYNALRLFDQETAMMEYGLQDVIYSVGYFDYLPDDFLVKMLKSLYGMLAPGGKFIAAFKDANRYRPQIYHWLVNWDGFLQRTGDDFDRIFRLAGIPESALAMSRVDSGSIVFFTATRA